MLSQESQMLKMAKQKPIGNKCVLLSVEAVRGNAATAVGDFCATLK